MITETNIAGQDYAIGKMSAMQQFHVSRRIAPILPALVPVFGILKGRDKALEDDIEWVASALQPLADGIAGLSDADAEYVIATCLSVVQRRQSTGWARVWTGSACMFQDIDMGVMLKLVVHVVVDNLGPFISGLLTSQQDSPTNPLPGCEAFPAAKTG